MVITETSEQYLAPEEIIDHIMNLHIETEEEWWESVESQVHRHHSWLLCRVKISSIPDLAYAPCHSDKVNDYRKLNTEPPPIVIDEAGAIIDGVHRAKAVSSDAATIAAFVPASIV